MNKKIELTPEELEELKDDIKFRTKVLLQLKALNGIPREVAILGVKVKIYGGLTLLILSGLALAYFKK